MAALVSSSAVTPETAGADSKGRVWRAALPGGSTRHRCPAVTLVLFVSSFSSVDVMFAPSLAPVTNVAAVLPAQTVLISSG